MVAVHSASWSRKKTLKREPATLPGHAHGEFESDRAILAAAHPDDDIRELVEQVADPVERCVKNVLFWQNLHFSQNRRKRMFLKRKITKIFSFDAKSSKTGLTPHPPYRGRARAPGKEDLAIDQQLVIVEPAMTLWCLCPHLEDDHSIAFPGCKVVSWSP
jgi:hypothetical protein